MAHRTARSKNYTENRRNPRYRTHCLSLLILYAAILKQATWIRFFLNSIKIVLIVHDAIEKKKFMLGYNFFYEKLLLHQRESPNNMSIHVTLREKLQICE